MQTYVSTVPFGLGSPTPLKMLNESGVPYEINPRNRKMTEVELVEVLQGVEILIAGTEPLSAAVLGAARDLKLISRVGVGLDNVNLRAARERGVRVTYTPDAPAPAVADLTIGLALSLLRSIHLAHMGMHAGEWHRYMGKRLVDATVGIIGVGRIGEQVLKQLAALGVTSVLANDIAPRKDLASGLEVQWVEKDIVFKEADLITIHVPLSNSTRDMVGMQEFSQMHPGSYLINTSRGGIVNEAALAKALTTGELRGAAVDVFESEPYSGPLSRVPNCLLTSHMGSMSIDCRSRMEIEATEDALRFAAGQPLLRPVPDQEYANQDAGW